MDKIQCRHQAAETALDWPVPSLSIHFAVWLPAPPWREDEAAVSDDARQVAFLETDRSRPNQRRFFPVSPFFSHDELQARDDGIVSDPIPYHEAFPVGSKVRVADRASLEEFMESWPYHHKLQPEQIAYAGRVTTVEEVGFYHGGDPVYRLTGMPGQWLEQCLEKEAVGQVG